MKKTNAMRFLESHHIHYQLHTYDNQDGKIDGVAVAQKIGQPLERVFKTLVVTYDKQYAVCLVPVDQDLSLKKAAHALGVKKISMLAVKDLLPVTGYIRGGCSPFGMKKSLMTLVDQSANDQSTIIVSAGKVGLQVELSPADLVQALSASFYDLTE